jgi:hypothetical protein
VKPRLASPRLLRGGIGLAVLLGLGLGCTKDPARPLPSPGSFRGQSIDNYPAWSNDGSSIAYFRFFNSSDGPVGIYIISRWGGKPRLVVPGLFYAFRFSPDDRRLAGVTLVSGSIQLVIIEVATGQMTFPIAVSPGRAVHRPGWSPDGQRIAYARGWSSSEPPDSGGIHILDLRTGEDRPIGGPGTILRGGEPRWLPTEQIAFVELEGGRLQLKVIDPDGRNLRTLHRSRVSDTYQSLHWYERHTMGQRGVLFTDNDLPPYGGLFLARPDGGAVVRMPDFWAPVGSTDVEAFSPDGEEIVHHGVDPVDSLDILFVSRVGDQASASTRQLTRYSPPPPAQTSSLPDPAFVGDLFQEPLLLGPSHPGPAVCANPRNVPGTKQTSS